jgi:hypothetical protein
MTMRKKERCSLFSSTSSFTRFFLNEIGSKSIDFVTELSNQTFYDIKINNRCTVVVISIVSIMYVSM